MIKNSGHKLQGDEGVWVNNPNKIGKLVTKIFFSDNVEWSSKKLWKMMSVDARANVGWKQKI